MKSVVIGMVHVRALPGSPRSAMTLNEITDIACKEAAIYEKAGMNGIILENMHDLPYLSPSQMTPETVSCMTRVALEVRRQFPHIPLGVQVLSTANQEALAIAKAADLNFIRAEGFVFSHIGDEGPVNSCAAELLRYRKKIGADDIQIFTDIKKKHSAHALTSDVSTVNTAKAAEMFLSDGIIVSGSMTGQPTDTQDVSDLLSEVQIPVIVGSGVTVENVKHYMDANALIVGSHFKMSGKWDENVDYIRVDHFMTKVQKLRARKEIDRKGSEASDDFTPISAQGE